MGTMAPEAWSHPQGGVATMPLKGPLAAGYASFTPFAGRERREGADGVVDS